jgi:hypothetical protein
MHKKTIVPIILILYATTFMFAVMITRYSPLGEIYYNLQRIAIHKGNSRASKQFA